MGGAKLLLAVGLMSMLAVGLWLWQRVRIDVLPPTPLAIQTTPPRKVATAPRPAKPASWQTPRVSVEELTRSWREQQGLAVLPRDGAALTLTLDPALQRWLQTRLRTSRVPYAAVAVMDARDGALRALAEVRQDPNRAAAAYGLEQGGMPATPVFALLTGLLLAEAGVSADTRVCVPPSGRVGEAALRPSALDTRCQTVADAVRRDMSVALARLGVEHLVAMRLKDVAESFGVGAAWTGDLQAAPGTFVIEAGELGLGRAAAGFDQATLTPLHAVALAGTLGTGRAPVRPAIVAGDSSQGALRPQRDTLGHGVLPAHAAALAAMLRHGPASAAGSDAVASAGAAPAQLLVHGGAIDVKEPVRHLIHWYVAAAKAGEVPIAIAVVTVNEPQWYLKAETVGAETMTRAVAAAPSWGALPSIGAAAATASAQASAAPATAPSQAAALPAAATAQTAPTAPSQ